VYSRPKGASISEREFAPTEYHIITGNRRWREEEFLIARSLTEGHAELQIKIEFIEDNRELFPGQPFRQEPAWSEARYWVYCCRMPEVRL